MTNSTPLTTLSLAILGLVFQRPMSGYDVKKTFSETPMGHFSASPGAIYPALERLAKARLLRGKKEAIHSLRPRLVYTLTNAGKEALKEHLCRPVTRQAVIWNLEELILRFAFMEPLLGREQTLTFLREFLAEVERHAKELQEHLDSVRSEFNTVHALTLGHGIAKYRMNTRWAKRALQQLSETDEKTEIENKI